MKKDDIELIVYDFDGVMTNNKAIIDQFGNESVIVNRLDGLAISEIKKMKISQIIISTEKNKVVQMRANKLQIFCLNGIENKKQTLLDYLRTNDIKTKKVVYIGNEINDLEAMKMVGIPIAPSDSNPRIKRIAKYITKAKGGDGVIREFMDLIN